MKPIRVQILDHDFPLRVREEDEAFTTEVAAYVDRRLREARLAAPGRPDLTHAILGALGIAEELFLAREALERLRARVDGEAGDLADRLEAALESASSSTKPSSTNTNEA